MDWKQFWNEYRADSPDLFAQVGKTVGGAAIPDEEFQIFLRKLVELLELGPKDHLVDLCSGNGVITREMAKTAGTVVGVDFCERLVGVANRESRNTGNVEYLASDVVEALDKRLVRIDSGTKVMMSDSLGYFDPQGYRRMVEVLFAGEGPERVCLTGIPMRPHLFFKTLLQKRNYLLERLGFRPNSGVGRWWKERELIDPLKRLGLQWRLESCKYRFQEYRSDLTIFR